MVHGVKSHVYCCFSRLPLHAQSHAGKPGEWDTEASLYSLCLAMCAPHRWLCVHFLLVLASLWFPIKHAGSDLHLIWIGLEALARSRPDSATLTCFQTKSIWPKHDTVSPNQDGYAQYNLGQLWENATEFGSRKLLVGWLLSAKSIPGDSCALACFWTKCIWPKPDLGQFNPLWSGPSLEGRNRMGCRKPDLAYTTDLILAACWL